MSEVLAVAVIGVGSFVATFVAVEQVKALIIERRPWRGTRKPTVGRPRKHNNAAERQAAYRERRGV